MPTLYRIFGNLHFIPRGDGGGDEEYLSPPPAI